MQCLHFVSTRNTENHVGEESLFTFLRFGPVHCKFKDENISNLRLLASALKRLKVPRTVEGMPMGFRTWMWPE
jgi:hypothetical protein